MKISGAMMWGALAAFAATLAVTGCGADCKVKHCADLVGSSDSLKTNNKDYNECLTCGSDGSCSTTLEDASGNEFFSCDDSPGSSCIESVVNAEFAFCEVN